MAYARVEAPYRRASRRYTQVPNHIVATPYVEHRADTYSSTTTAPPRRILAYDEKIALENHRVHPVDALPSSESCPNDFLADRDVLLRGSSVENFPPNLRSTWNEEFQAALQMSARTSEEAVVKYRRLMCLSDEFVAIAKMYGKVSTSNHTLSPS